MQGVPPLAYDPAEARKLYYEYRNNRHYGTKADAEIRRALRAITRGEAVIRALDAIKQAGVNEEGLPKLAIARADHRFCWYKSDYYSCRFASTESALVATRPAADLAFDFPDGMFPPHPQREGRRRFEQWRAIAPPVPERYKPKANLSGYHLLWEAEWEPVMTADPLLIRRIGKADLWVVVAAWDLSPIEREILGSRIASA